MTDRVIRLDRRYELLSQIGRGGMGVVYRAHDLLNHAEVALKQVKANPSGDTSGRAALIHEFRVLATLRHPHVIGVLDYGISDKAAPIPNEPYFTMRLLEEPRTVTEYAPQDDVAKQVDLLVQMLMALAYLHRRGVIHRDVKPTNVLVDSAGQVQVLDFGLAAQMDSQVEAPGGTVAYMAPELLDEGAPSVVSDLYAVGVIAYELFAGRHPFDGRTLSQLLYQVTQTKPDLKPLLTYAQYSGSNPPLHEVIAKMMHRNPAQRYQESWDAIEALCGAFSLPVPEEDSSMLESFLKAAKFVGRDEELKALRAAMQQVSEQNKPATWLVGGVSGIGKSRLLEELRIEALVSGWRVLRGQSSPEHPLPFELWRAPVRELMLGQQLTPAQAAALSPLLPETDPNSAADEANAPGYFSRLARAIADLMQSDDTPILLILEDLHWASNGLDLLFQMRPLLEKGALLIVGSYRDDECPELPTLGHFDGVLLLRRFEPTQIVALSQSMLGDVGAEPELIRLVERETEGNPFFMVEVMRALAADAGTLRQVGHVPLPEHVFAGGVRDLVRRRIERLPAWAAQPMLVAAVAGRAVDLKIVKAVSPDLNVEQWLSAGANVGVLEVADEQWRFSHDKLRDALLAEAELEALRTVRLNLADAIEAVYPGDARFAEAIFEHLLAAGEPARALPYGLRGARAALTFGRYDAVRRICEAALNLDPDAATRAQLLLAIAEAALFQSDYPETERIVTDLAPTLDVDDPTRSTALLVLAQAHLLRAEYEQARRLFNEVHEHATMTSETRMNARALYGLGQIGEKQGDVASAGENYRAALELYRALNDIAGIADTRHGLGGLAFNAGDLDEALRAFEESLSLRRTIGDPRTIASSLNNIGTVYSMAGDQTRSIDIFTESLKMRRMVGEPRGIAISLLNLGHILLEQGDLDTAYNYLTESHQTFRKIGAKQGITIALNNLGLLWRLRGQSQRARALFEEAHEMAQAINDRLMVAHALNGLAMAALELGDPQAALTHATSELVLRREFNASKFIGQCLCVLAEAAHANNASELADAYAVEANAIAQAGAFPDLQARLLRFGMLRGKGKPEATVLLELRPKVDAEMRAWIDKQVE